MFRGAALIIRRQ